MLTAAVLTIERTSDKLELLEPGLHWHEKMDCKLFPVYDSVTDKISPRYVGILLDGDGDTVCDAEVHWGGEPFSSNGVNGICVSVEAREFANKPDKEINEIVILRIADSIKKLKAHKYPGLPGSDPIMDACWRH